MKWNQDSLEVEHPTAGRLPVETKNGCPQLPRKVALKLIEELEATKQGIKFSDDDEFKEETRWMRQFVEAHPVLSQLPMEMKKSLVVKPGPWSNLPANRRKRKAMKRDGFVCHLYAGLDQWFTLQRAWEQCGGGPNELLEIDLQRGEGHNMLDDHGPYSGLLRAVWENKLRGLVGGPNCRTRSVMRHKPVDWSNPPRPVRKWGGEEYGIKEATPEEKKKVTEDDQLLWRMIFLAVLDEALKTAQAGREKMGFGIEQPASPKAYNPDVVSLWDTPEWKKLKEDYGWLETTFSHKPLGGQAVKPTTMGENWKPHLQSR